MKKLFLILVACSMVIVIGCKEESLGEVPLTDVGALEKGGEFERQFGRSGMYNRGRVFFAKQLNLTAEQKVEIENLVQAERENFRQECAGLRGELSKEEWIAKREEHSELIGEKIKSVLTPEQIAKFDELKARRGSGEFFQVQMNERLDRLTEELELTEEQITQLEELFFAKFEERKENKGYGRGRRGMGLNQEKRQEFHAAIVAILTSEQLVKFEEMSSNRFPRKGNRQGRGCNGRFGGRNW